MKIRPIVLFMIAGAFLGSAVQANSPRMHCNPRVVRKGESFTIFLPKGHPKELGVRTPDNRFLFVAFEPEKGVNPPVPGSEFLKVRTLKIKTDEAVGLESISSGVSPELIFTFPGKYRIILSENLETEDEANTNQSCIIELKE